MWMFLVLICLFIQPVVKSTRVLICLGWVVSSWQSPPLSKTPTRINSLFGPQTTISKYFQKLYILKLIMYSREANQSLRKFKPRFTSNQQVKRQLSLIQVVVLITVRQNVFYLQTRQAWQSYRLGHLFRSNWGKAILILSLYATMKNFWPILWGHWILLTLRLFLLGRILTSCSGLSLILDSLSKSKIWLYNH